MLTEERFRINTPHVVHDTIEGETIIVNLKNGNYYSFEGFGIILWDALTQKADLGTILDMTSEHTGISTGEIEKDTRDFIAGLLKEELIVGDEGNEAAGAPEPDSIQQQLQALGGKYESPVLNKYADMQDMLLLDPIHDTNEKGWPQAKLD